MDASEVLDHEAGVAIVVFVAFLGVGLVYLPIWIFVFSATVSYVGFDVFMSALFEQGEGYIKFGLDNDFQSKGHGLLAFIIFIIVGTALVSIGLDWLTGFLIAQSQISFLVIFGSAIAVIAAVVDVEWRFAGG